MIGDKAYLAHYSLLINKICHIFPLFIIKIKINNSNFEEDVNNNAINQLRHIFSIFGVY